MTTGFCRYNLDFKKVKNLFKLYCFINLKTTFNQTVLFKFKVNEISRLGGKE